MIAILAPFVVRLTPRVGAGKLLTIALVVVGIAMWVFASFNLNTDYTHYAIARVIQGVGLGFFFVPVSQLAYSYIPLSKNNKASSITNLFRNLGGSFGVAFVTTMLERRTQFHHSVLAQHVTPDNPAFQSTIDSVTRYLASTGASTADATQKAYGLLSGLVERQAALLAFQDCYRMLAVLAAISLPLAFMTKRFRSAGGAGGH